MRVGFIYGLMLCLFISGEVEASKPKNCVVAEEELKRVEKRLYECQEKPPYMDSDIGPHCRQEYDELLDAQCRRDLACTPSTKDPRHCSTALPRG